MFCYIPNPSPSVQSLGESVLKGQFITIYVVVKLSGVLRTCTK